MEEKTSNQIPAIKLPKGGGAISGIGEKFQTSPVTGTGSLSVPIATSPGRSGFSPQLSLNYDSGSGNSPFGLGWSISLPSISRKTAKGIPRYQDETEGDTFLLSGAEDLVPVGEDKQGTWERKFITRNGYTIYPYRPRLEGLFARIERWVNNETGISHWRAVTKENVTTIYGESPEARIVDPQDEKKIYKWLIEKSFDDKGNIIIYKYKKENLENVKSNVLYEKNRVSGQQSFDNQYLKCVKYGNTLPYRGQENFFQETQWLFQLVFDYGEHDQENPTVDEQNFWPYRPDPFSDYHAGFEIRTYRLCRRILMFHNFIELGPQSCLVRSTDLIHDENPVASLVTSIIHAGYQKDEITSTYLKQSMPPLEFTYTKAVIDQTIHTIHAEDLENVPNGIDGIKSRWFDLEGEGLNGILTEQGKGWYYKRNQGHAQFSPVELVATAPSISNLAAGQQQLMDLGGEGQQNLVVLSNPMCGFYELEENNEWETFTAFQNIPNLNWKDPNLRMIDLNGDGHADILITENDCFVWYPSRAKEGFEEARFVSKALDEEKGPALIFSEATQSVYLADMSGDGSMDIVRIRNGEVCYWPNLGYGRFGAKFTMANAPMMDHPDYFDQKRLRLADFDGSGTTDIIYLGKDVVTYWINQSGNSWSETGELTRFPKTDNLSSVSVIDLFGNGTSSIVWSSPIPAESHEDLRYMNLMGGKKPYLLCEVKNNMGAVTRLEYASSTKFYLEDRRNGHPWITKLPFPVHVVERSEIYDEVTGSRFVTLYVYHHGYFDGVEREFHGFGLVEQWDTETYAAFQEEGLFPVGTNALDETSHVPPVYTKTWFHTGFYQQRGKISGHYEKEYYQGDAYARLLPDTVLPANLSAEEQREACRALKGSMLRQEVYAQDNKHESQHPYTVTENTYHIEPIQPKGDNRHAVFFVYNSESLSYHYERNPADPRISHQMTLETDEYGNPTKSAAIVYPRRNPVYPEQGRLLITYNEAGFINKDDSSDFYRIGVPYENKSYEITGIQHTGNEILQRADVTSAILNAAEIPFEDKPNANQVQKRLIGHSRNTFYSEDLTTELPLGQIAFHALPYQSYQMAFTTGLIDQTYNNDGTTRVTGPILGNEGKYVLQDGVWWTQSGRLVFDDTHFYLPIESIDQFSQTSTFLYDVYGLLLEQTFDPLANTISAKNDYRVLQSYEMTGPNGNRSAVAFDVLGMVVRTAVMGKAGETDPQKMGDTLANPTSYMEYELFNWMNNSKPNFVHTFTREAHGDPGTRWQESYTYSGGLGQEILTKVQAEPGLAFVRNPDGTLKKDENGGLVKEHTDHRWVGNGRTIFNNKGKPVKQYEPYFSSSYEFEDEDELREYGVTPIIHYDPLTRVIRTDIPDGTFSKVEFTPWKQESWDQNDTVIESDWYADRGSPDPQGAEPTDPEQRAAYLAAKHANTPQIAHLDTLGRTFLTIEDNGNAGQYETRVELDIKGNTLSVTDAKNRVIARNTYNLLDTDIYTESVDAGNRRLLNNVAGNPLRAWDQRDHEFRHEYDQLQRPTCTWVKKGNDPPLLVNYTVYGEQHPNAAALNLRGRVYEQFDQAGVVINDEFDFKGNLLHGTRQMAKEYKQTIDWSALTGLANIQAMANAAAPLLQSESFTTSTEYDALNRPVQLTTPDNSNVRPVYNEANFLETLEVQLRGAAIWTPFVNNIDYDEKGQRVLIEYGNNIKTEYAYDKNTFRLINIKTTRNGDNAILQDLTYTYDPVGNITGIRDDAQQTIFFNNAMVDPHNNYIGSSIHMPINF